MNLQVQEKDFDVNALYEQLQVKNKTGAVVMFVGLVREFTDSAQAQVSADDCRFELEYYPGMTEHNLSQIIEEASDRWAVLDISVVHRVGTLSLNDQIVFVGVSASHRAEAFLACDFIMDYLKSRAAFWKKETTASGGQWVLAKKKDQDSLERWA